MKAKQGGGLTNLNQDKSIDSGVEAQKDDKHKFDDCNCGPFHALDLWSFNLWENMPPVAVGTNLLYDAAAVPNIALKANISGRWNAGIDWMYARWSRKAHHRYYRIYGGDIDLTWRIGAYKANNPFAGHHIGAYASIACYDFQFGKSHTGVLSAKYNYAAGILYNYSLPVSRRLNIDFSIGVGYAWGKYKRHTPIDDHDVWKSTHRISRFMPTRAGISLVWLLGARTFNDKK